MASLAQKRFPEYETIQLETEGRVARLTLNRPSKLNALDPPMLAELLDALSLIRAIPETSTVLLTGSGRVFCAGTDTETPFFFNNVADESAYAGTRLLNIQHRLIEALYELPQITVAGVNGDAVGGAGFGMAMACDLRVAIKSARFWMVPGMLDAVQDFALTWLLQRQVGASRTLRMAALGEPLTAETAERWGLVDAVVEDVGGLEGHLAELAARLSTVGTDALRMLKLLVRAGEHTPLREQLGLEAVANGLAFQSREFREKHDAYLQNVRRRRREM